MVIRNINSTLKFKDGIREKFCISDVNMEKMIRLHENIFKL